MRENVVTCDICKKLLLPTKNELPDSFKTHFHSVEVRLLWNEEDIGYDVCPRCFKRMERYLRREAKRDGGAGDEVP